MKYKINPRQIHNVSYNAKAVTYTKDEPTTTTLEEEEAGREKNACYSLRLVALFERSKAKKVLSTTLPYFNDKLKQYPQWFEQADSKANKQHNGKWLEIHAISVLFYTSTRRKTKQSKRNL